MGEKIEENDDQEAEVGGVWTVAGVDVVEAWDDINEVVEATFDSGVSKSVWPMRKMGVERTKRRKNVRLTAANGSAIHVEGDATLQCKRGGRMCAMKFLDADVQRPLGAVSAIADEGNTVVFSRKQGSNVENDETGERIPMMRKGGTFVMMLQAVGEKGNVQKMNVNGLEGDEDEKVNDEEVVFRRRVL